MALLEVKKYEVKFIGMPIGREPSVGGKKGKLTYSPENCSFNDIGERDAEQGSETYGKKICKVGGTYILDQWQLEKYGAAFDLSTKKQVKGYVIDDGETKDEEVMARKKAQEESAKRRREVEGVKKKEADAAEEKRLKEEEEAKQAAIDAKANTQKEAVKKDVEKAKGKGKAKHAKK